MRQVTEEGINLIKRFEGFSSTVYICPAGYPTIGYGHLVLAHEQEQFATGITQAEATELLRKDVRLAERAVLRLISVPLTDGQFDARVSFTFNLGAGALQRSTLRMKVNRRRARRGSSTRAPSAPRRARGRGRSRGRSRRGRRLSLGGLLFARRGLRLPRDVADEPAQHAQRQRRDDERHRHVGAARGVVFAGAAHGAGLRHRREHRHREGRERAHQKYTRT